MDVSCLYKSEEGKKKAKEQMSSSIDQCDTIGVASASDVSPSILRADET